MLTRSEKVAKVLEEFFIFDPSMTVTKTNIIKLCKIRKINHKTYDALTTELLQRKDCEMDEYRDAGNRRQRFFRGIGLRQEAIPVATKKGFYKGVVLLPSDSF